MEPRRPLRVLIACSGLDHARRGFETFARECFEALRTEPRLRVQLMKGSGPRRLGERPLPTLRRDRALAALLSRARGGRAFVFEHLAFGIGLQPSLARLRPDVVFLSEWYTARVLARIRASTGQRFKLLLSNGSLLDRGFERIDHVQELTPAALDWVLDRGASPSRHTMLPLGLSIEERFSPPSADERAGLRSRLGLPADGVMLLSVAALNAYHKRLDYLIEEVARSVEPRPHLVLAGEPEEETPMIRALAEARLGADGYTITSVPQAEMPMLYRAADMFVLSSLWEGLPRALLEAMAHGLPCLTHSYPVAEFATGPFGLSADLSAPGGLADLLARVPGEELEASRAAQRHRYAYGKFSWDALAPSYVELLERVAANPPLP